MSDEPRVKKEFFYPLGKKVLKKTMPDSVWWFTKVAPKAASGMAWATKKGDRWYKATPGDRPLVWFSRREELKVLRVREVYIGRLMLGICWAMRGTPYGATDIVEAVAKTTR